MADLPKDSMAKLTAHNNSSFILGEICCNPFADIVEDTLLLKQCNNNYCKHNYLCYDLDVLRRFNVKEATMIQQYILKTYLNIHRLLHTQFHELSCSSIGLPYVGRRKGIFVIVLFHILPKKKLYLLIPCIVC